MFDLVFILTYGGPGSVTQVRSCAQALVELAKQSDVSVVLVGHVTKDGGLAGPKVLEHVVDTVLGFEGDRHHALRVLRAAKHRFGSTHELGLFEMTPSGLVAVPDVVNSPSVVAVRFDVLPALPKLVVSTDVRQGRPALPLPGAIYVRATDPYTGAVLSGFTGTIVAVIPGTNLLGGRASAVASAGQAVFDSLVVHGIGNFAIQFSTPGTKEASLDVRVAPDIEGRLVVRGSPSVRLLAPDTARVSATIEVRDPTDALVSLPVQVRAQVVRGTARLLTGDVATRQPMFLQS